MGQFHLTSGYVYNLSDSNTLECMRWGDLYSESPLGKVTSKSQISFHLAQELLSHLDAIPKGPTWHCMKINTTGYVTKDPVYFFWHNALEVTWEIFGNPVFTQHMEYDPYQDQLPTSAAIIPIVLASDKAPITGMTGDIEMHPLFLTITNIDLRVHMKVTSHAWVCIVYMLAPDFIMNSEVHLVLEACIWHCCMDIVCAGLKLAAHTSTFMSDPNNATWYCFTLLAAYTADLLEQLMITCVMLSVSPVSTAKKTQFGDATPHLPHDGEITLQKLHLLCQQVDPWRLQVFLPKAKKQKLSGIQLPFWQDWQFSNPAIFLIGELLHFGHKMFFDHPFKWCKELLGHNKIDTWYHIQHKHVLTFTLLAIHAMEESLQEFHMHKDSILRAGVQQGKSKEIGHFQIPKLELLQSSGHSIHNIGSLIQYSADISKQLLITCCKDLFMHTNHQRSTFTEQIILWLDHEESICCFNLYSLLLEKGTNFTNVLCLESDASCYIDLTVDWVQHVSLEEVNHFHGLRTFHNHFLKGIVSDDSTTMFHITVKPDFVDKSSNYFTMIYNLPDFPHLLWNYINGIPGEHHCLGGCLLKGWTKFQLQLHSHHPPNNIIPSQQVQALPPSAEHPLGKCDAILVHYMPPFGTPTVVVAQVQAIFAFSTRGSLLPTGFSEPLLYVQYFAFTMTPTDRPNVTMYTIECMFIDSPEGSKSHVGAIISLLDVIHAVELIPNCGVAANHDVTSQTCQEVYNRFFLNNFTDKEWYYTMYHDYQ
ncbi:hypothetical protein EDD16DRAFT_1524393 [Pisolithus croceorrhizus]|nr:hypothetical protein EDD16DRAFT_1524393 [Pisolithus croceorrhizus]